MGRPTTEADATETETELTITIDKGNKQWVAIIGGTDSQYGYDREFISPYGQGTATETVADGTVIETCWHSHSGNEKGRTYHVVVAGDLCEIDADDVERALDARVVRIDADSVADEEAHECEESAPVALADGGEDVPEVSAETATPETTADYREAGADMLDGDGEYRDDWSGDETVTDAIAAITTRLGGRVPVDFAARVQDEGYARQRDWTVYAPTPNPYHIAAALTDCLEDRDGLDGVRVRVVDETAAGIERELRSTRLSYVLDSQDVTGRLADDDQQRLDAAMEHYRYVSALTPRERADLGEAGAYPDIIDETDAEAERREESDDPLDALGAHGDLRGDIQTLARWPHDAWGHHRIHVTAHEEATTPVWG